MGADTAAALVLALAWATGPPVIWGRVAGSKAFFVRRRSPEVAVRPEGANHQWRKNPPGELSIDPVADERLMRVTAWVGAS